MCVLCQGALFLGDPSPRDGNRADTDDQDSPPSTDNPHAGTRDSSYVSRILPGRSSEVFQDSSSFPILRFVRVPSGLEGQGTWGGRREVVPEGRVGVIPEPGFSGESPLSDPWAGNEVATLA